MVIYDVIAQSKISNVDDSSLELSVHIHPEYELLRIRSTFMSFQTMAYLKNVQLHNDVIHVISYQASQR